MTFAPAFNATDFLVQELFLVLSHVIQKSNADCGKRAGILLLVQKIFLKTVDH